MKPYLAVAILSIIVLGCNSGSSDQSETSNQNGLENNCEVSGSVQTTVFDGSTILIDVPNTQLRVDPLRQFFVENIGSNYIDVSGLGWGWLITGSLRWTGELNLDPLIGLESGIQHTARIFYELNTGDLNGLVFVPEEPIDTQGTISATLRSEYRSGNSLLRTRYGFGLLPDHIQTSTEVFIDWRYNNATNEIIFEGVGSLDLGESSQDGWEANPVVTICLGADVLPF